jgi:hypothetical protein
MKNRRTALAGLAAVLVAGAIAFGIGIVRLRSAVSTATDPARAAESRERALSFTSIGHARIPLDLLSDSSILSVSIVGGELWTAGGAGLSDGTRSFDPAGGLPSLRVAAIAAWRKDAVFGLEAGGWGRVGEAGLEKAGSGWGELEVRSFAETDGGELVIGARQGLFVAPFSGGHIERISGEPVRAVALLPGGLVAAGGEKGLRILSLAGSGARPVATPDPWIESIGWDGKRLWASTPLGSCLGDPLGDRPVLEPHPRGGDVRRGLAFAGAWWGIAEGGRLAALRGDGTRTEEPNPDGFRRLFAAGGGLLAEGPSGLFRKEAGGWMLARKAPPGGLSLPHVNALAVSSGEIFLGLFDGGIEAVKPGPAGSKLEARPVSGTTAWGVNALWPSGETVWAATLRGVFKIRGGRAEPVEGPGAAFSLAPTSSGIALGYGQGVSLPGRRLLSAFHGLPGNQAYALAAARRSEALWVGTPTGLGRIENARVTARALPGEGKLPNPWVTALLDTGDALVVGTWGGGLTLRTGDGQSERWSPFPETDRLRVNAGAIAAGPNGGIWIGTQGEGLWRSDPSVKRFVRVRTPLPSLNVYSLAFFPADHPDSLFAGTDQGMVRIPLSLDIPDPTEAR